MASFDVGGGGGTGSGVGVGGGVGAGAGVGGCGRCNVSVPLTGPRHVVPVNGTLSVLPIS
jgi:hypothetical protein